MVTTMKRILFLLSVFSLLVPLAAEMNFKSTFDWKSKNVKSIGKEIEFIRCEFTSPRLIKCAAVRIDLSSPAVRFKVTPRSAKWGEKMPDFPQRIGLFDEGQDIVKRWKIRYNGRKNKEDNLCVRILAPSPCFIPCRC